LLYMGGVRITFRVSRRIRGTWWVPLNPQGEFALDDKCFSGTRGPPKGLGDLTSEEVL